MKRVVSRPFVCGHGSRGYLLRLGEGHPLIGVAARGSSTCACPRGRLIHGMTTPIGRHEGVSVVIIERLARICALLFLCVPREMVVPKDRLHLVAGFILAIQFALADTTAISEAVSLVLGSAAE